MVATVQQSKTNQASQPKAKAGQKTPPPNKKDSAKLKEEDRKQGASLAGKVGEGLQNAAASATQAGTEVMKESLKGGITQAVANFVGPIRFMVMSNPIGMMAARPLVKFLAPKLEEYLAANNIELPVKASAILNQVLFGDLEDLDGEVAKALDGFIEKALPEDIKAAIQSGNVTKIATLTGASLTSGAKGLMSQIFNTGNNKFTSPFKFLGAKLPLLNKLSPKFQPWAAGAGVLMFGGLVVRLVIKATKLLIGGTLLATGGVGNHHDKTGMIIQKMNGLHSLRS